jgi:prephenate dehydrogenase
VSAPGGVGSPGGSTVGRVGVVGAGQVGTALGMALRGAPGVDDVAVADRDRGRAEEAAARGAGRPVDLEEALAADAVVLAVPVPEIAGLCRRRGRDLRAGALLVDTGSAKRTVVEAMARWIPEEVHAVGGHPIAGTERPGPEGASPDLLRGVPFVLCPVRDDPAAMERAAAVVEAAGARPVAMGAADHDRVLARTSHLPHAAAAALALVVRRAGDTLPVRDLVAGGYRSATRVIASDPVMVSGFLTANAGEVRAAIDELLRGLEEVRAALDDGPEATDRLIGRARAAREWAAG